MSATDPEKPKPPKKRGRPEDRLVVPQEDVEGVLGELFKGKPEKRGQEDEEKPKGPKKG